MSTTSTDAILARAQLHFAATQRLVTSWLPPPSPPRSPTTPKTIPSSKAPTDAKSTAVGPKTPSALGDSGDMLDEDEVVMPERFGLGALPPPSGSVSAVKARDDALRRKLFGRKAPASKPGTALPVNIKGQKHGGGGGGLRYGGDRMGGEEEEEEEGRSGIGKGKGYWNTDGGRTVGKRKNGGYLDEVLKGREGRKKRRLGKVG